MGKNHRKGLTKDEKDKEMDAKILKVMLMYHEDGRSNTKVEDVARDLEAHPRSKAFRSRWSFLMNTKHLIGKSNSGDGLELTKKGLDEAATPEYKARIKELSIIPKTNKEHQERIKKYLKKTKSAEIFDFLNTFGSLTKHELAALVGQNPRSHGFFYSFNELRDKRYLEPELGHTGRGKTKYRLADKAFKSHDDRPKEADIDTGVLEEQISKGHARIESRKTGQRSNKKKITKEKSDEKDEMEIVPVVSADYDTSNEFYEF